jgi:YfiH family protein
MPGILFTSRAWGNFGLNLPEDSGNKSVESDVIARREFLRQSTSVNDIVFMNQTHSDVVKIVDGSEKIVDADAIITTSRSVALAVLVGDCVPVLLKSDTVIAAIHAGRIGMTNGIIKKAVSLMMELGAGSIEAILGPSICVDCYEVDPDMYFAIIKNFPHSASSDAKHALNLQAAIASELNDEGVEVLNLGICTREHDDFYSHRRSISVSEPEGRQIGLVHL